MKHLFIINPVAGGHDSTGKVKALVTEAFQDLPDESYEFYVTRAPKDATAEILRRAETGEELHVYSCGGDGTFNECINGAAGKDHIAVAPFPIGTGNDFCRMFGEEKDLFLDIRSLIAGTVHPIDLIACNGIYSVNICSAGIDARVGINVHKYSSLPLLGGRIGSVVSLIIELLKGLNTEMKVRCGGKTYSGKFALACVCNGRYYGGGFMPSADAMPDDGELDIYLAKGMNLLSAAANIGKYASGRSDEAPQHIIHLKGQSITIEFAEESVINIDGEGVFSKTADMKLERGALNLIVPNGSGFFS